MVMHPATVTSLIIIGEFSKQLSCLISIHGTVDKVLLRDALGIICSCLLGHSSLEGRCRSKGCARATGALVFYRTHVFLVIDICGDCRETPAAARSFGGIILHFRLIDWRKTIDELLELIMCPVRESVVTTVDSFSVSRVIGFLVASVNVGIARLVDDLTVIKGRLGSIVLVVLASELEVFGFHVLAIFASNDLRPSSRNHVDHAKGICDFEHFLFSFRVV